MIVHRLVFLFFVFCSFALLSSEAAMAHGGVVEEDDLCVIKVGFLRAHFKVYQPRVTGHEQFCEDLPVADESVFVMEYQHDALSTMPIDFRIVRDVTGKGRFARIEDIDAIADLPAATVFYQDAQLDSDVYTVIHDFDDEGDYIGIVSARHPDTGKVYSAVFPFEVGFTGLGYWPFFVGLLILIQIQYLFMSGRMRRWFGKQATVAIMCVMLGAHDTVADETEMIVTYTTPGGAPKINQMHTWILHISDSKGVAVEGAIIEVTGGMPTHDHGLPTRPRVTTELGGGNYQLEGMRFHMTGDWEIVVRIETEQGTSLVTVLLSL